jgi:hypothetical protein
MPVPARRPILMTPTQASKNDLGCRRSVAVAVFVRSVSARPVSGTGERRDEAADHPHGDGGE